VIFKRGIVDVVASKEIKAMFKALDGKKTLIGVLIMALPTIGDSVARVISAAGGDPGDWVKIVGGVVSALGMIHKFLKDPQ
jgi:hypothetical protein